MDSKKLKEKFWEIAEKLFMGFINVGLFASKYQAKPDVNKHGSRLWKEEKGIEYVMNSESGHRIYRDKNGNYYSGSAYVPIAPPVNIIDKNKK